MSYLAIIDAGLSQSKLHVFKFDEVTTSLKSLTFLRDDVRAVVEGGLHKYAADDLIGIPVHLAPILKYLELALKEHDPHIKGDSIHLFLLATGLQGQEAGAAGALLKQAYAVMKEFECVFNVGSEATNVRIPSQDDLTFFTSVSLHQDRNLAGSIPIEIFARGAKQPVKLKPSGESKQMCLELDYDEWQSALSLLSSTGSSSWVTGAAVCIITNKMSLAGSVRTMVTVPPLEIVVSGNVHLKHGHESYRSSIPSWGTPLFHQINHHRENEARETDIVRIVMDDIARILVGHETTAPVIPDQPDGEIKEKETKELQAVAIKAVAQASVMLAQWGIDGECVVFGEFALSLLGAKATLDLTKIEVLLVLNEMTLETFFQVLEEAGSSSSFIDHSPGIGKRLKVLIGSSYALIHLVPVLQTYWVPLVEGQKSLWDDLDTSAAGVKFLSPGPLLVMSLLRWAIAYDIVYSGHPSLILWNTYADATQDVLLLLEHIVVKKVDISKLEFYAGHIQGLMTQLYSGMILGSFPERFGIPSFPIDGIDPQALLQGGDIVERFKCYHTQEGREEEIERFAELLDNAATAINAQG